MCEKKWILLALSALLAALPAGCGTNSQAAEDSVTDATAAPLVLSQEARTAATVDLTGATEITLSGDKATVSGSGAEAKDGVVTISAGGTYVFRGSLTDGRILVDAKDQDVILVLDGAEITCSYGSPIYGYKAQSITLHLMEGSENSLTDGADYTFEDSYSSKTDEEPDACIYSKADLTLQGAGSLTINGNYKNGITCKDNLEIYDLTLNLQAANNGICGKDSATIDSAAITVSCQGDAIRSTNDSDETLGWVTITNSALSLNAGEDGIQGETDVTLSGVTCTVVSGASSQDSQDDDSGKGIKGGTSITLLSGVYTLDCQDDAIHSNGDVTISDGTYQISSGDDAIHADSNVVIDGGDITIADSYEGVEGLTVTINDGTLRVTSSDDGINASDGSGDSFMGGFSMGGSDACSIQINGGYVFIEAQGDGFDSNGSASMTGGTLIVSSSGNADAPLDYESSFALTGGTLLAIDNANMTVAPTEASQNVVFASLDNSGTAGSYVSIICGDEEAVFQLPFGATAFVYSSPALATGEDCVISVGGDFTGTVTDYLGTGGTYSGGTELTTITLEDGVNQYGSVGMMGGMGGMGGFRQGGGQMPGGDGNEAFQPDESFQPDENAMGQFGTDGGEGEMPEMPTDGELPTLPDGETFEQPDGDQAQMPQGGGQMPDGKMGQGGQQGQGTAPSGTDSAT
jgi:hypothetical protein